MKTFLDFMSNNINESKNFKFSVSGKLKNKLEKFTLIEPNPLKITTNAIIGQANDDSVDLFFKMSDGNTIQITGGFSEEMEYDIVIKGLDARKTITEWNIDNSYFKEQFYNHGTDFLVSLIRYIFYPELNNETGKIINIDESYLKIIS